MKLTFTMLAVLMLALPSAAALAADRLELPIRLVVQSDGTRRFGVPVTIDGRQLEAGLDTGSTGLRVMARAMPGNTAKAALAHYSYGSGTRLDGPLVTASVAFGAVSGPVKIQRVDVASCKPDFPQCPAKGNDPATFGIQGDGLPGEGFAAILGVNLRAANAANPFEALGARRWIVELPRPGDPGPGRIILNPSEADVAGFTSYRLLDDDDSLAGCITGPAPLGQVCGRTTIDSGAPGLFVFDTVQRRPLTASIPVTLTLGDAKGQSRIDLVTGRRDQASNLILGRVTDSQQPIMHFGVAPYWRWSVLYDADAHTIGLRPR